MGGGRGQRKGQSDVPSLVSTPATWPTPPISMNISLADCLLASIDSAGQASSHTPVGVAMLGHCQGRRCKR
jgi:hypothetical protein